MTRAGLEGFGRTLHKEDEVVVEATGDAMVEGMTTHYQPRSLAVSCLQSEFTGH
jgi:transposase